MRALHGSDVFHLREEGFGRPAHTLKVAILGPRDGTPPDADAFARWAARALGERSPFRWQVHAGLVHLGRPMWSDATPHDDQVVRHTLEGSDRDLALDELLSCLAGDRLPRDRPLWRLWIVEGLGGGRLAAVLQMHHALADGASSVRIWEELFTDEAPAAVALPPRRPAPDMVAALRRNGRALRDLPRLLSRMRANSAAEKSQPPAPARTATYFEAPPTRFNQGLTRERTCTFATLSLATVKEVGHRLGGTVNDVYAAVSAGALRAYLLEHDSLPPDPLTATMPAGVERGAPYGNAVSTWFVRLATDEGDPRARFNAVRVSLQAARELQARDPSLLHDLQDHTRLYDVTWRLLAVAERRKGRPTFNLVISNVRGPGPLDWQGHPVAALRSIGPLAGRMGLNLTAWSYGDDFTVGLHACRDQVPDLPRLAQLLEDELSTLAALDVEDE